MKNIHRLMLSLCLLSAVSRAYSTGHDASAVAHALTSHIKGSTESHYQLLQKELKARRKQERSLEKQELRSTQKRLQDECNEQKHALQSVCNEKKRDLYDHYMQSHTAEHTEQLASSKSLKMARKAALFLAKTLKAAFEYAQEYLDLLIKQSAHTHCKELTKALEEEQKWLDNLEKTTKRSGISFDEPLKKEHKKMNGKRKKAALTA